MANIQISTALTNKKYNHTSYRRVDCKTIEVVDNWVQVVSEIDKSQVLIYNHKLCPTLESNQPKSSRNQNSSIATSCIIKINYINLKFKSLTGF